MLSRNKKIIIWILAAGTALGIISAAAWFLYSKIQSTSAVLAEAENKIKILEEKGRELSKNTSVLEEYKDKITLLEGYTLSDSTFVDFVKLLENLAVKSGIKFTAENAKLPASPTKRGEPASTNEEASISFKIEGAGAEIFDFLALLDQMPFSGIVDTLAISAKTIEPAKLKSGAFQAKINYTVFNFEI